MPDATDAVILAADLGGTSTRALVAGISGPELSLERAGSGNPNRAGVAGAAANLREAAARALLAAAGRPVAAVAIGMAGLSHPESREVVRAALDGLPVAPVRILEDDRAIAFRAAFEPGRDGVLVMAGTGSGAVARGPAGLHRAGGLGPLLGDEGSAHDIAMRALRLAARLADGRAVETPFLRAVLEAAGVESARDLPPALAAGRVSVAPIFRIVARHATAADEDALNVVLGAGRALANLAAAVASTAGLSGPFVAWTSGSVLSPGSPVRQALGRALEEGGGGATLGGHVDEPVRGALGLARDALAAAAPRPPDW